MLLTKIELNEKSGRIPPVLKRYGKSAKGWRNVMMFPGLGLALAEAVALTLSYAAASQVVALGGFYDMSLLLLSIGVFLVLQLRKSRYTRRKPFWDHLYGLLETSLLLTVIMAAVPTLVGKSTSGIWVVWLVSMILIPLCRFAAIRVMSFAGIWQKPTVIVGDGPNAIETAKALMQDRSLGYEVMGFLAAGAPRASRVDIDGCLYPVESLGEQPDVTLRQLGDPHIIMALERGGLDRMKYYFDKLNLIYPMLSVVPALRGIPLFGMEVDSFFSHEVMMLNVRNNLVPANLENSQENI